MFKVGQKVVCVFNGMWKCRSCQNVICNDSGPKKGDVVTINGLDEESDLNLKEYSYRNCKGGYAYYQAKLFSPLQEQSNFAEESLKEVRIQQLEHRLDELEKLVNHPEKSI